MKKVIYFIIGIVLIVVLAYTFSETGTSAEVYNKEIEKERTQKNRDFTSDNPVFPLTAAQKKSFSGLNYFPPNVAYNIAADLEVLNEDSLLSIATTTGEKQKYVRYAYAHFQLANQKLRLTIYKSMDRLSKGMLFVPFTDPTNGKETYEGGRYLDVKSTNGSSLMLDFNRAYNPYCAYNETYSCPIPPRENHLKIPIEVGEKTYK
jgi:uncharacterized protein